MPAWIREQHGDPPLLARSEHGTELRATLGSHPAFMLFELTLPGPGDGYEGPVRIDLFDRARRLWRSDPVRAEAGRAELAFPMSVLNAPFDLPDATRPGSACGQELRELPERLEKLEFRVVTPKGTDVLGEISNAIFGLWLERPFEPLEEDQEN